MLETASSTIVNATLLLLIAFSVVCWTIIPAKILQHLGAATRNRAFTRTFWAAADLGATSGLRFSGPAARVAQAGLATLRARPDGHNLAQHGSPRERMERALRAQLRRERQIMEAGLPWLASIGSTAPFVGLFGTVWGIRHALQDISRAGTASIDVVAGPIGEALIATAIGIAVAIPAVVAYNILLRRQRVATAALDGFATDFMEVALPTDGAAPVGTA
ncbi:MAG: MotA/TolQ/ExbB proton channel family protein [Gammaproteobacteria bacterium]|nr:MotA/TolQ/ExbB proton channel family protein [Gammaproteobacteria bacterium]MBK9426848.1 MotA/TolQ/ExbB proton channel family protein [Gammaproteobacteria bacterium]